MARVSTRSTRPIAPGAAGRISPVTFLQETASELRKSVWPSREETARLSMVVIALAVAAGFFLGGLDRIFAETFTRFIL
ncbi:MAG: preprotein translocase subunit SecE [SAR202 cluster bacterium Io17-Chloro-G9]|nr:MAG: preprotein translocase subunit SecE [SAR202 cluster bacterium Io17-Chloro-G9]